LLEGLWVGRVAVGYTLHVLQSLSMAIFILVASANTNLVLGEQCVADSGQQHHCDQERDEAFGRHDGGGVVER
jgi:hypothetical protein